ncbi:MAG: 50S ribosomal protein L4 [bacterium]|nr:50S ribosomal protein L4 [bacterium]
MKATVYNWKAEEVGNVELVDGIFGKKWNADLVHQVTLALQANQRRPWAHAKGRGEVRGGGIKPWKQKGTGRARHGSTRSPIWRSGGASHGPTKERDYSQKINKKMLRGALHAILSKKLADGELKIIESVVMKTPKTKEAMSSILGFFKAKRQAPSTLVVSAMANRAAARSYRNISRVELVIPGTLNVLDLMKYKNVLIEKAAISEIK